MYTMEDFLKWLDENEYLKDDGLNYKIITEQYLHSNIIDKIKNIFDSYYHIYNTMVWYEEWENIYKCTFSNNWFKDTDTEVLNEKLNDIGLNIVNIKIVRKQQNPNPYSITYNTTTSVIGINKYEYVFEIGEIKYDEED